MIFSKQRKSKKERMRAGGIGKKSYEEEEEMLLNTLENSTLKVLKNVRIFLSFSNSNCFSLLLIVSNCF